MMDEVLLNRVRSHMRDVKPLGLRDKVYKEECMFSFNTPESPGGLYVNLSTFQGFSEEFVQLDHERTGGVLYLHEKWRKVEIPPEADADPNAKPSKMAVGGADGFQVDRPNFTLEKEHALALLPDRTLIPLPCPDLPELVLQAVNALIARESASLQEAAAVWEEERRESRYAAGLVQLPATRLISPNPKDWKCDETGATENLWLNLGTGHIGSGRQNWDGSGGQGTALLHYEATGKQHPLVVKLGTITPDGADVYSYAADENDMVLDPLLDKHLAHWGINMVQMRKTEKTMAELQIDLNLSFEFDKITESGSALQPLSGPGYVGLINLGNSCYMNSVLQLLWRVPDLRRRYVDGAAELFRSAPSDPASDLATQMAKVGTALLTGRTGQPPLLQPLQPDAAASAAKPTGDEMETDDASPAPPPPLAVRPQSFKSLVARGHAEFSSARQQDADEYMQHLLDLLLRAEHASAARLDVSEAHPPTSSAFAFRLQERTHCTDTGAVSYKQEVNHVLSLLVPLEAAINKHAVEEYKEREAKRQKLRDTKAGAYIGAIPENAGPGGEEGGNAASVVIPDVDEAPIIPVVPFEACLQQFASPSIIDDYKSAAAGKVTQAQKVSRLLTFPPYLVVKINRYYMAPDWTPKKREVLVEVPDELSLGALLRGVAGPQPGELLQPEDTPAAAAAAPAAAAAAPAAEASAEPNPEMVAQLVSMGFSEPGSSRAVLATGASSVDAAMEWVLSHMEDADFNDPLPPAAAAPAPAAAAAAAHGGAPRTFPVESVSMLTAMGFGDPQAEAALIACSGSVERAADWLFSHMEDLDSAVAGVLAGAAAAGSSGAPAAPAALPSSAAPAALDDGPGDYRLAAFISHMGSNTACGHYVCHVHKDGQWVIYNDEKVARSEAPPRSLGYMYLFERVDRQQPQQQQEQQPQ